MSPDSLPPGVLLKIDRICDDFEGAWRAGGRPRIEDFLEESVEPRGELFRELLARELELRREAGEVVEAAHYERRFEVFLDLVRTLVCSPENGPPTAAFDDFGFAGPVEVDLDRTDVETVDAFMNVRPIRPPAQGVPALPARIGRFQPIALIGQGNFLVYRAREGNSGREFALKVARPDDPFSRRRFTSLVREAQRLASLDHPGIVKVHEFVVPTGSRQENEAGGDGFIVLEYVQGQTLEALLQPRSDLPLRRLVEILGGVADAVHHAHLAGLVHRDLKPSNILIDGRGEPRVCDFGLAVNEELLRVHRGEVAGTLYYMAPEQVRGETHLLDGRTDIWALGVILYRGLTGRLPFNGKNASECFDEILRREPRPPRQSADTIPRRLERICLRCLSKSVAGRYLTAADVAADLRGWLSRYGRGPQAEPSIPAAPKGLRAFGNEDAASFLTLLPGPHGPDGLPDSIRFWKSRIEDPGHAAGFRVGLIHGPAGAGKTSFVRAGLLPQLDRMEVHPICVPVSPAGTEARLLGELRQLLPQIPVEANLAEALAIIRDDPEVTPGEKLLLVLDQFENWLQGHSIESTTELVLALRQCDGRRVQALLVVRDGFWISATRLFHELGIPPIDGENSLPVALLDWRHVRNVLESFGRSLGVIPDPAPAASGPAGPFLDRAVESLIGPEGRMLPFRLSLFVEIVRHREWTAASLEDMGGIQGIELKFLEMAFDSPLGPPACRMHREAARRVLALLLPATETGERGSTVPEWRLRQASGYTAHPADFASLLHVLDHDLRLVTPVEVPNDFHRDEMDALPTDQPLRSREPFYQFTHDFLIGPVRRWLEPRRQAPRQDPPGRVRRHSRSPGSSSLDRES